MAKFVTMLETFHLVVVLVLLSPENTRTEQAVCPRDCSCDKTSATDDVTSVTCNHAGFSFVPRGIPTTTTKLSLKGTRINTLRKDDLRSLTSLEDLELNNCNIEEIEPGAFDGLSKLKQLSLVRNKLGKILGNTFRNLSSLSSLNLMLNTLTEIHDNAFVGSSITRLQLDNNHGLWNVSQHAFRESSIKEVSITFCNISSESLNSLRSLQNSLKTLTITDNSQQLFLPDDLFKGFTFDTLKLERNGIRSRYFLEHVQTSFLSLSGNPLGPLAFFQFPLLQNVLHMRLDNTGFKIFDYNLFDNLPKLLSLDMSNNGIRTVPNEMEPLIRKLSPLRLNGNPLHCNCRIIWLRNYISENPGKITGLRCTTPEEGDLISLNQSVFKCIAPYNISSPAFVSVPLYSRMSLSCSASGDPAPKIIWRLISGGSVQVDSADPNAPGSNRGDVYVTNMTRVMYGIYHCIAVNVVGELRSLTNVTGAEYITDSHQNQTPSYTPPSRAVISTPLTTVMSTLTSTVSDIRPVRTEPTDAVVRGGKVKSTIRSHDSPKEAHTTQKYQKTEVQSKRDSKPVSKHNSASVLCVHVTLWIPLTFVITMYNSCFNLISALRCKEKYI